MVKNMKKFIIVIVFIFLIAILISFNYLLWDREQQMESYQNMKQSNNLTIDTLSEKMNNLDRLNRELTIKLETITNDNETIRQHTSNLNGQNSDLKKEIEVRDNMIIALKKNINVSTVSSVIKKWTDSINSKNYENALACVSKSSIDSTLVGDANELKNRFKTELKEIKIKSCEPFTDFSDDEHIKKLQLKVVFDVVKPLPNSGIVETNNVFSTGTNERYVTMEFDSNINEWFILEIKNEP